MTRTTHAPRAAEMIPAPQDSIHILMFFLANTGKWLAQPGPRNQPG
jgi:hypothetical protein